MLQVCARGEAMVIGVKEFELLMHHICAHNDTCVGRAVIANVTKVVPCSAQL